MYFVFQWFQFITLLLFHFYSKNINNNDKQSSTLSKYSSHIRKGGYQTLGGVSVEKWDNELEDRVLLI